MNLIAGITIAMALTTGVVCEPQVKLVVVKEVTTPELSSKASLGGCTTPFRWFQATYLGEDGTAVEGSVRWTAGPVGLYFNTWDEDQDFMYICEDGTPDGVYLVVAVEDGGATGKRAISVTH